jgi:glycosyltransferase involved in cell wall biosynthesis
MNSVPLVSVCIPSYNHAQYLPYCLDSVLAQTYPNIEVIIIDDGSTDNSLEIAREYAANHPDLIQVHTHPNGINCGISKTSNLGFSLAKGKYWSGLSSDDALYKDKIEKQVAYLETNPEVGFVYSYSDYIDAQGNKVQGRLGEDITQEADPLEALLLYNVIPTLVL